MNGNKIMVGPRNQYIRLTPESREALEKEDLEWVVGKLTSRLTKIEVETQISEEWNKLSVIAVAALMAVPSTGPDYDALDRAQKLLHEIRSQQILSEHRADSESSTVIELRNEIEALKTALETREQIATEWQARSYDD